MRYKWLNKNNNNKLILFFNGWAMNETAVSNMAFDDFDVLMFFDYRKVDFDFSIFDFNKYDEKYLICWSMGGFVANLFKNELKNFDKKIAINSTNKLIDNNYGIPDKIYRATAKFLNEQNCDKFIKNMFQNGKLNPQIKITRPIEELREELFEIQKINLDSELKFDKVIISKDDKIIPTKNQLAFWENKADIELINSTHCPFENYKSWKELIC